MDLPRHEYQLSSYGAVTFKAQSHLENGANYELQNFIFPSSHRDAELYLRQISGELAFDTCISTFGPAKISFNSYFNSFYEDYWIKHTVVDEVQLEIVGTGEFWCSVYRETKQGGCVLVEHVLISLGPHRVQAGIVSVALVPKFHGHGGRLFVDLKTLTTSQILGMSWRTTRPPPNEIGIGVGLCTFNREPFLLRTLESLITVPSTASILSVVVVNQGRPLNAEAIQALAAGKGPELRVIDQANFGGAGGFARSAIELMELPGITHILFMDDDIALEARHLCTTTAFLRYAEKPVVVGGHMLDLFNRKVLYEAGNTISPDNQLHPNHHNLDLTRLASLTALSRASASHFNGWWYAATPVSCFRDFGLPLPIFIRGDDLEFGTRLHNQGVETVSLPPVSVWHEPFYAKAPGWQLYYDLRNRLIFASINNDRFGLDSPTRLSKLLMVHLIRYDYQQAWFMMQALTDFMRGPALLDEGLPAIHARVVRDAAAFAPTKMNAALGLKDADESVPDRPWATRGRMAASFGRLLAGRPRRRGLGVLHSDVPLQWVRLGPAYVLSDRGGHFFQRYAYSRTATWKLLLITVSAIRRYSRGRATVAEAWKAAYPTLVSDANWRTILGLNRVPESEREAA